MLSLLMLLACGGASVAPTGPAPVPPTEGAAPPLDAAPPTSEIPPPPSVDVRLARLATGEPHHAEQEDLDALARVCEADCTGLLAYAADVGHPAMAREGVWWALTRVQPAPTADAVEAARAVVLTDDPANASLRSAAARVVARGPGGTAWLLGRLDDPRVEVRAAGACALGPLTDAQAKAVERKIGAATLHAMGICATPWAYGQQQAPSPDP